MGADMITLRISERREKLLLAAEELQREKFEKSIRALEQEYQKEENRKAVIQVFEELASSWNPVSVGIENKKKAASLGITYLLSSILMGTYEMRLYLMGEEFWMEEAPLEAVWRPAHFYEHFDENMEFILKKLEESFPRMCRAEKDAIKLKCADYYLAAVCKLCRDISFSSSEDFGRKEKSFGG